MRSRVERCLRMAAAVSAGALQTHRRGGAEFCVGVSGQFAQSVLHQKLRSIRYTTQKTQAVECTWQTLP
jgi:hypothetical protein